MKEIVADLLKKLKGAKIPVSKVEKDLKFSNGQLGQVAKGKSKLSEERLNQFTNYCWSKLSGGMPTEFINPTTKKIGVNNPKDTKEEVKKLIERVEQKMKEPKPPPKQVENRYLNERWKLKAGIKDK